jgi:hypothetical protein
VKEDCGVSSTGHKGCLSDRADSEFRNAPTESSLRWTLFTVRGRATEVDSMAIEFFFRVPFSYAIFINTFSKCCVGMRKEKKKKGKEKKRANYRIETCRKVLISTPLYQVGAGTFVT